MAKDEKNKKKNNQKNSFLKESKAELKKVNWPTPKRLANDTGTVIGIVLVVAIIVFVLDLAFLTLNENLIIKSEEKLKNTKNNDNTSIVQNIDTENQETENNESTENSVQENTESTENSVQENTESVEPVDGENTAE